MSGFPSIGSNSSLLVHVQYMYITFVTMIIVKQTSVQSQNSDSLYDKGVFYP